MQKNFKRIKPHLEVRTHKLGIRREIGGRDGLWGESCVVILSVRKESGEAWAGASP